jgi:hypothetical protein
MHKLSTMLVLATIGIVIGWSSTTTAQSRAPANTRCPAGYWMLESASLREPLCLNGTTGDVVNAEPEVASRIAFERGCAPGYWRLESQPESLCLNSATGDVELVDEERWPDDGKRAEVRK